MKTTKTHHNVQEKNKREVKNLTGHVLHAVERTQRHKRSDGNPHRHKPYQHHKGSLLTLRCAPQSFCPPQQAFLLSQHSSLLLHCRSKGRELSLHVEESGNQNRAQILHFFGRGRVAGLLVSPALSVTPRSFSVSPLPRASPFFSPFLVSLFRASARSPLSHAFVCRLLPCSQECQETPPPPFHPLLFMLLPACSFRMPTAQELSSTFFPSWTPRVSPAAMTLLSLCMLL